MHVRALPAPLRVSAPPLPGSQPARRRRARGQSLVEFALVFPVLLLLALFALDFGRVFLGWITLNNMARVGADFAARHPDAWANGTTSVTDEYAALIAASYDAINCTPDPADPPPPTFGGTRQPGQPATVALACGFEPLTPIVAGIVGNEITVAASATFPVTYGCLAGCTAGGAPPPPPAAADNCRTVPDMVGLSLLGARNAWVSAGFSADALAPDDPADDPRTVTAQVVTEPANDEGCTGDERFVFSTASLTLAALPDPPPTPTCVFVPRLTGMTVAQARGTWTGAGLDGVFTPPTGVDDSVVTDQFTTPATSPDDCVEPPLDVQVTYGDPLPEAPAQPCLVPNFANTSSATAETTWSGAGFTGAVTFRNAARLPYTIKSQSLVGGTFMGCDAPITLSNTGSTN